MLPEPFIVWCGTTLGRICTGTGIVLLAWGLLWGALKHHDNKVRASVYENSKIEGKKINETNRAVTVRARQPGAFERLRRDSCRDC